MFRHAGLAGAALVSLLVLFPAGARAQVPPAERAALLDLFQTTQGASWAQSGGWGGAAGTECTWQGVGCSGGRVVDLLLRNNGLQGSLAPSFSDLSGLQRLRFGLNGGLGGPLPDLSTFGTLRELDLGGTQLSGPIPDLGAFPRLTRFFFHLTQLAGPFPDLSGLPDLERFSVPPGVTGSIPSFANNPRLQYVWIAQTPDVVGPIPPSVVQLSQLVLLDVRGNHLAGEIPALHTLPALQTLFLGHNMLTASDPALIAFLDANPNEDWSTQTIAPGGLAASNVQATSLQLDWAAIRYTADGGAYEAECIDGAGTSYVAQTADKLTTSVQLTGLPDGALLSCRVRTRTDAHALHPRVLTSAYGPALSVQLPALPAPIPASERTALLDLYQATGGASWLASMGWLGPAGSECSWFGVTCTGGRVTGLALPQNALQGTLPATFASLDQLQTLDLRGNALTGTLPPLHQWPQLQQLFVGYNMLHVADAALVAFLDANPLENWRTQTVAPQGLVPANVTPTSFELQWQPVTYTADGGHFEAACSSAGAPHAQATPDKSVLAVTFGARAPGEVLDCQVRTFTPAHVQNPLALRSSFTAPVRVTLPKQDTGTLTASFQAQPNPAQLGEAVQFVESSHGSSAAVAPSAYTWDFGDGAGSTLRHPTHTYATSGTYTVKLTVTGSGTSATTSRAVTVLPAEAPVANFRVSSHNPVVGEEVVFLDDSSGPVTSMAWDFGDGATSTARAPRHTFGSVGTYTVALTVSGPGGSDVHTATIDVAPATRSTLRFARPLFGAAEDRGVVQIAVRLEPVRDLEARLLVHPRTAQIGADFEPPGASTLTWVEGGPAVQTLDIPLLVDDDLEPNEFAALSLAVDDRAGVVLGDPARAWLVIQNDDFRAQPEAPVDTDRAGSADIAVFTPPGGGESRRVLVWETRGDAPRVVAQMFDASGAPLAKPFPVSDVGGRQSAPQVVFLRDGGFAVVWRDQPAAGATVDGRVALASRALDPGTLVGRFFDPDGIPTSEEIPIAQPDDEVEEVSPPDVDVDGDDEIVTTWREDEDVFLVRSGPSGPLASPLRVPSAPADAAPRVARVPSGEFAVVWEELGASPRVLAQFFDTSGAAQGAPQLVAASATTPSAAAVRNDGYAIVWTGADGGVFLQRLDLTGAPSAEGPVQVALGPAVSPVVAANVAGDLVVAWERAQDSAGGPSIDVRLYDAAVAPLGGSFSAVRGTADAVPSSPRVSLGSADRVTLAYAVEDAAGEPQGVFTTEVEADVTATCASDGRSLCLQENRFEVRVDWRSGVGQPDETSGAARAVKLTDDTGYFWFFDEENVELLVKVLDACTPFERIWFFAGGLTDVETTLVVSDTLTGESLLYRSEDGAKFVPIQDTDAFASCDAAGDGVTWAASAATASREGVDDAPPLRVEPSHLESLRMTSKSLDVESACTPDATRVCLADRFAVEATYTAPGEAAQAASATALTRDTAVFWFFDADNVELVVKVLDGCVLNQSRWVFAGGLTDVEVQLRVTDMLRGETVVYTNPQGQGFAPVQDTQAILCE